jgi:hypothetical protein
MQKAIWMQAENSCQREVSSHPAPKYAQPPWTVGKKALGQKKCYKCKPHTVFIEVSKLRKLLKSTQLLIALSPKIPNYIETCYLCI